MSPTDFEIFAPEFDKRDDCVDVTFCDGTAETYDMLIGADVDSINMGIYMCKTLRISNTNKLITLYVATGKRMLMTHIQSYTKYKFTWASAAHEKELGGVRAQDVDAQKAFFGGLFQNAGLRAEELVGSIHKATDFYVSSTHMICSGMWSANRVVLVGDAGYLPTPLSGFGTSVAPIGATMLAGEIAKYGLEQLPKAPEAYEKSFRPYVEKS
ncbi:oxidoreductase-like protein [Beauveria bassiana ARSEF 2860]|uniref:Oxidoreductase-like protein n=1 Tax=Beauveria bassiana (strain ARSEF 2860) TaxID=655819 RepID=J4UIG3_BEAB2|nr:oxidoreductase-like protein [Beauveria bassiana ARSEF 2860]EJP63297.1 oxidoreductase-like protein [Beauveria bassiana ARSEF 2860]